MLHKKPFKRCITKVVNKKDKLSGIQNEEETQSWIGEDAKWGGNSKLAGINQGKEDPPQNRGF